MTLKIIVRTLLLGLVSSLCIGCASDAAEESEAHSATKMPLHGSWQRDVRGGVQTFTLTFFESGQYAVINSEQQGSVYGDWSLQSDTLTIQDTDCKDYVGTYRIVIAATTLSFVLIHDGSNRPEVIPGSWQKVL